jgi:hypothetical protein
MCHVALLDRREVQLVALVDEVRLHDVVPCEADQYMPE